MDTVLRMDEAEIGHRWEPITDLTDADRAAASEELPPLARMWQNIRGALDPMQVHDFNERLKREWAIETGVIERLYTLDHGTTQLLIEQGIDASLIASGATDQPPELVAGMIQDHAVELQPVSDGVFQINYEEPAESVKERFRSWLEDSLVMGLDQWNRSE